MSHEMVSGRRWWRGLVVAGCLFGAVGALPVWAEDAKAPEKPSDPPPPPARAAANSEPGGRGDPGAMLDAARARLDTLNLTDEQRKSVDAAYASAKDEIKKAMGGDSQERAPALRKTMADLREKVGAALTDEQKAKMAEARGGAAGAGRAGSPIAMLQGALDRAELTADQKEKVKPVMEEAKKKFDDLRSQIQGGDRAAVREKYTSAMNDLRDKLKGILTPEQAEKVKATMDAARPGGATTRPTAK